MPPHTPTPMYTHKCIHTVLVNILQYANEYTHLGVPWRGGARVEREEGEGKGRSMERGRGGGRGDRGIKVSYSAVIDEVNLQEATALGHMQGC